jgi:hypothetical protein
LHNNSQYLQQNINISFRDKFRYLGMEISTKIDDNEQLLQQFTGVRKSFYSLYKFGMKPIGLNPKTKSKIYNCYCIPKITYGIGILDINLQTKQKLEIQQNNIWRGTLGLHKRTKMSCLKQNLGILKISTLINKFQIVTAKLINRHPITKEIFQFFEKNKNYSHSFSVRYGELVTSLLPNHPTESSLLSMQSLVENTFQSNLENNDDIDMKKEIENILRYYNRTNISQLNTILTPNRAPIETNA